MNNSAPLKAWFLLISLALIWGSSFILIKRGLLGLTPLELGSLRIFAAALVMSPFAIRNFKNVSKRHIPFLIAVGLVGSLLPAFLFAVAQTQLESAITGVLNALTPIFTVIIGAAIYQVKQPPAVRWGILIGFVGTFILITAGSGGDLSAVNYFALLVVLATIFYALNVNIIKYRLQELKSLTITSISLAFVGPFAFMMLMFFTDFPSRIFNDDQVLIASGYIITLGVFGTALALIIFNRLVGLTDPIFTSSVTYLIPIVSIAWGLLDGEKLLLAHYIGIAATLLGVYIANRSKMKKA